jgi:hypothetical protein
MVIALVLVGICPRLCALTNPNPQPHVKTYIYDGGLLNARACIYILSFHIFFLNLGGGDLSVFGVSGVKKRGYCRRSNRVREKL